MSIGTEKIKCVLVGDPAVGKSSIITQLVCQSFSQDYMPTVYDNRMTTITVDGKACELSLWDTSGQDQHSELRPLSYAQTDIYLLVFSLVIPNSLDNIISKWAPELRPFTQDTPKVLVGNKLDLRGNVKVIESLAKKDLQPVTSGRGFAKAKEAGVHVYKECSALTGEGLTELFETAVRLVRDPPRLTEEKNKKCCTLL